MQRGSSEMPIKTLIFFRGSKTLKFVIQLIFATLYDMAEWLHLEMGWVR